MDKTIQIPAPLFGGALPFLNCVVHVIDSRPGFREGVQAARSANRIVDALEKALAAGEFTFTLRSDDYDRLRAAFNDSSGGYMAGQLVSTPANGGDAIAVDVPLRAFLPFIDAVENAADVT